MHPCKGSFGVARRLGCVLVLVLLSGCSSKPDSAADAGNGTMSATPTPPGQGAAPAPVALPAIEVYNGTLTFASATGGSAGSGTFEVPKDYGNLTVTVTGFGDCPGYSKQGAIHITANGLDESLPVPFTALFGGAPGSDAAGYEPSSCSAADLATDRVSEATAAVTWSVGPGTGSLQATGEFTGEARVVVVAGP